QRGRVFLRTRLLVRTTGGGDECRWYAPFSLTSPKTQRDKLGAVAGFHAQENAALAALLRLVQRAAHIAWIGDFPASNFEDDVASLKSLFRCSPVRIDIGHHHAFGAAAGDLRGRSEREAQPRHFTARVCRVRRA